MDQYFRAKQNWMEIPLIRESLLSFRIINMAQQLRNWESKLKHFEQWNMHHVPLLSSPLLLLSSSLRLTWSTKCVPIPAKHLSTGLTYASPDFFQIYKVMRKIKQKISTLLCDGINRGEHLESGSMVARSTRAARARSCKIRSCTWRSSGTLPRSLPTALPGDDPVSSFPLSRVPHSRAPMPPPATSVRARPSTPSTDAQILQERLRGPPFLSSSAHVSPANSLRPSVKLLLQRHRHPSFLPNRSFPKS
jgi:hypothetical protein